jgi:ABC-2 type transport system permease protein
MNKLTTLLPLLKRDLIRAKREFLGKFIDSSALLVCISVVFGYLMTDYGLGSEYGLFILVSAIASIGFFGTVSKVFNLITDIEGDRTISYTLTLPIPSWLVFVYIGFFWALESALTSVVLYPVGKLILFNYFDLCRISYWQLIPMFIAINLFYGFFSLWLASILHKLDSLGKLWIRVINPLIMFGAYYNSWAAVYESAPVIGLIELVNPLVYVMEGMRTATLGTPSALPFWLCISVVCFFAFICGWHGTHRLQQRLDCVR